MQFIDKYGYPVEVIKGKPIKNFFRRVILTRRIKSDIKMETIYKVLFGSIIVVLAIGFTVASLVV